MEETKKPGEAAEECSVCVAVNIRPLVDIEIVEGCQESLTVSAQHAQVGCCGKSFLFDKVYGHCGGNNPDYLFKDCVEPLVNGLFKGYNATVFAYGQTGSGKTYTMGSAFTPDGEVRGVIPSVLDMIFAKIASDPNTECSVRVSFVEIHKEDIRDLLVAPGESSLTRSSTITVREVTGGGGVCLAGATEKQVFTKEETGKLLEEGSLCRATAATGMNNRSSRSHAIFTITLEQRRCLDNDEIMKDENSEEDDVIEAEPVDDFLTAKMHLVDLAGSERAKRTKAEGQRLQEAIDINKGLLALGKVISALVDNHKHVPYRDSKLTRLLQDSLGGNSRTVMIACVSPADINLEETLNTLRYANQARNIKNKPVVNRDPVAAQMAYLRQQLALARAELSKYKKAINGEEGASGFSDPLLTEAVNTLEKEKKELQTEIARMRVQLDGALRDVESAKKQQVEAQCERDSLKLRCFRLETIMKELQKDGVSVPMTPTNGSNTEISEDVIEEKNNKIAELELEVQRLRDLKDFSEEYIKRKSIGANSTVSDHLRKISLLPEVQEFDENLEAERKAAEEEEAFRLEQQRLGDELMNLDKSLVAKEKQYYQVTQSSSNFNNLKQQYEKQLREMEQDRCKLQKERQELMEKLQNLKAVSSEDKQRMEENYRAQLKEKNEKLKEMHKKEKEFMKIEKLKIKADEACTKLRIDVERIKQQKVMLHKMIETKNKEYNEKMKSKEREMLQLKKQSRVTAAKLQKIEALHAKQQNVLKRKTEEADAARKRLKEVTSANARNLESRNRRANTIELQPNSNAPLLRDDRSRVEWVEQELDLCNQSWDLKRILDGEYEQRKYASRQLAEIESRLKQYNSAEMGDETSLDSPKFEGLLKRKEDLEKRINYHLQQIKDVQAAYEEAKAREETKGVSMDTKRWSGIRSAAESKSLLKIVFKVASDYKAQCNEYQSENFKLAEESADLQSKLELMTQEVENLRVNLVRAEAVAMTAASLTSRVNASAKTGAENKVNDDDIAKLLQELDNVAQRENDNDKMCESDAMEVEDALSIEGDESENSEDENDESNWDGHISKRNKRSANFNKLKKRVLNRNKPDENEILEFINKGRKERGEEEAFGLTNAVLQQELKRINPFWTNSTNKDKEAMLRDFRIQAMSNTLYFNKDGSVGAAAISPKTEKAAAYLEQMKRMHELAEQHKNAKRSVSSLSHH